MMDFGAEWFGYILSIDVVASFQLPGLEGLVDCLFSLATLRIAFDEATLIVVASSSVSSQQEWSVSFSVEGIVSPWLRARVRRSIVPLRDSTVAIAATVPGGKGLKHAVERSGVVDGEIAGRLDAGKAKCHAPKSRWEVVEVGLSVARRHEMSLGDGLLYGCRAWIKLGQSSSGSLVASDFVAVRYVRHWYTAATIK